MNLTLLNEIKESFGWADFLDVAIIAVVIYFAITWIRQTASRSVILGVSVVAAIYFLARTFDLYLTATAFQGVFAALIIVVVVVFQEDIRRIFERIAVVGTFRERRNSATVFASTDTLVEAMSDLAEGRMGALVVLKGKEPLDRHIQGGVLLQGRLSKPLLHSIFDDHSPGHDGAVLLEGGRVTKFGCHLPLSKNLKEIAGRGTRHTAALGLSECSDAMILVVSEETGSISVAHKGRLKKVDSAADLKNQMEEFWKEKFPPSQEGLWKQFLRQDARIKILSVVLAGLSWLLFAYQPGSIQRTFVVPVEYRNLADQWALEGSKLTEAKVTLSGSERAFTLLNPGNLILSVDLANIQEGKQQISLSEENLPRLPSRLGLYRVEPNLMTVEAHRVVLLELPVKIQRKGELSSGLTLGGLQAFPPQVKVKVWQSVQEQMTEVLTEPIALDPIKKTQTLKAKLLLPEEIRLVEPSSPVIQVEVLVLDARSGQRSELNR